MPTTTDARLTCDAILSKLDRLASDVHLIESWLGELLEDGAITAADFERLFRYTLSASNAISLAAIDVHQISQGDSHP